MSQDEQSKTPENPKFNSDRTRGERAQGPWVFGLSKRPRKVRFFIVEGRTAATLLPIVHKHFNIGSTIVSDEWRAYERLSQQGFRHETVNHSRNLINLTSGFFSQHIERAWVDGKSWVKRARGAGPLLKPHLDECCWRKLRNNEEGGLFAAFRHNVKRGFD